MQLQQTGAGILLLTASRPRADDSTVLRLLLVPQDRDGTRPSKEEGQGNGARGWTRSTSIRKALDSFP